MTSPEDRFLNLALINIGEAVTEISNRRQQGLPPGTDYNFAAEKLLRAISALAGTVYVPEVAEEHRNATRRRAEEQG